MKSNCTAVADPTELSTRLMYAGPRLAWKSTIRVKNVRKYMVFLCAGFNR